MYVNSYGKIIVKTCEEDKIIYCIIYRDYYEPLCQQFESTIGRVRHALTMGQKYCNEHHNHPMVKSASKS